jgi:hypothetical protein
VQNSAAGVSGADHEQIGLVAGASLALENEDELQFIVIEVNNQSEWPLVHSIIAMAPSGSVPSRNLRVVFHSRRMAFEHLLSDHLLKSNLITVTAY